MEGHRQDGKVKKYLSLEELMELLQTLEKPRVVDCSIKCEGAESVPVKFEKLSVEDVFDSGYQKT